MTEFVPGSQYRLDIVGSDESILVDSWNNFIKGSVAKADGTVMVDTSTGNVYATLVGSIVDSGGTVLVDLDTKNFYGNLIGDVVGDVTGDLNGNVTGNLLGDVTGNVLGSVTGEVTGDLYGDTFGTHRGLSIGDVAGDVTGNVTGNVTGDLYGDVFGNVTGTVTGEVTGDLKGDVLSLDGSVIVDQELKIIRADGFHGTFYGDLVGNLQADAVVYGTFNGEMSGTMYGEFFGDVTGNITGDVVGDVTGNLTGAVNGSLTGDLLGTRDGSDVPTRLNSWDTTLSQWNWVGGVGHPVINEPTILIVGSNIEETEIRSHVSNPKKLNSSDAPIKVVELNYDLNNSYAAQFRGQFFGPLSVEHSDGTTTDVVYLSDNSTVVTAHQGRILLSQTLDNVVEINANTVLKNMHFEDVGDEPLELVRTHKKVGDSKASMSNSDTLHMQVIEGYNGAGYVTAGTMSFFVDENDTFDSNGIAMPTGFSISLSDSTPPGQNKDTNLQLNNKGVLEVKVLKARPLQSSNINDIDGEEGMIIFNTTTKKFQGYTGTAWVDLH